MESVSVAVRSLLDGKRRKMSKEINRWIEEYAADSFATIIETLLKLEVCNKDPYLRSINLSPAGGRKWRSLSPETREQCRSPSQCTASSQKLAGEGQIFTQGCELRIDGS